MTLLYPYRSQFKSPVPPQPGTGEEEASPRVGPPGVTTSVVRAATLPDKLRNFQCRVMDWAGFDLCLCHGGWVPQDRMDSKIDGLCERCGSFVWFDRLAARVGLRGHEERK